MTKRATLAGVMLGAVLLIIGSFLTWISVDLGFASFSSTGIDSIEGKLTAAAGIILAGVGMVFTRDDLVGRISRYLGLAVAIFGGIVLTLEYLDVRERIAETDSETATATVGLGVWVTAIGALAAMVATAASVAGQRRSAV